MSNKKYLVETSAVPVALGESTTRHCDHFAEATADGEVWTSLYVRKEFIARWILSYIRMAFVADHFQDLAEAQYHLSQDFSIRDVKTQVHAVGVLLQTKGKITSTRAMAKELARLALGELRKFDKLLKRRTRNACGCQIGGKEMKIDFNNLFDDLRAFCESQGSVENCDVNKFLGIGKIGRASQFVANKEVVTKTTAGRNLAKRLSEQKPIACEACATIGDAVIAPEQPKPWCLVHIDHDFEILCAATSRQRKSILSERAIETDVPELR